MEKSEKLMRLKYKTSDLSEGKEIFKTHGFVLIEGFVSNADLLASLRDDAEHYVQKAREIKPFLKDGNYTYYLKGVPTLWGVDNFLSFLTKGRVNDFRHIDLVKRVNHLLEGFVCSSLDLNRVHLQRGDFLHKLAWHHDEKEFNQTVGVNLYLEPESGFRLTTKDHILNNREIESHRVGNGFFDLIRDFISIHAEPGDLLLFDGKLLHQPFNKGDRLHLHFSFSLSERANKDQTLDIFSGDCCPSERLFEGEDRRFRNRYVLKIVYLFSLFTNYVEKKFLNVV